jgi:hypothetical protein
MIDGLCMSKVRRERVRCSVLVPLSPTVRPLNGKAASQANEALSEETAFEHPFKPPRFSGRDTCSQSKIAISRKKKEEKQV